LCSPFLDDCGHLPALLLDAPVEQLLWRSLRGNRLVLSTAVLQTFCDRIGAAWKVAHRRAPLIVDVALRRPLRDLLVRAVPGLTVLACAEVPHQITVSPVAILRPDQLPPVTDEAPGWSALVARPLPHANAPTEEAPRFATPERRPILEPVVRNA
jgi:hypothetical protein